MKFYLHCITPLHISTGRELQPIDYVLVDNFYFALTEKFLNKFLYDNNLIGTFNRWINKITKKISDLEIQKENNKKDKLRRKDLNKELSELRSNLTLLKFCEENNKRKELINALKNANDIIKIPITQYPQKNIREQIKGGLNEPYVPGTSIKGAIRTALLFRWLKQKNPKKELIEIISNDLKKNGESSIVNFASKVENLAFYCGIERKNDELKQADLTHEKYDLLKLLSVSDGKVISSSGNNLTLVKTNLYLQNNTLQGQAPWVEAIAPNTTLEFTMDFNINFLFALKQKIVDDAIVVDKVRQWIGIASKTKELFGIDIAGLTENNLEENRHEAIRYVLTAISEFSNAQKKKNEYWQNRITSKATEQRTSRRKSFDKTKIDFSFIPDKNSLNLGYASGFIGTTELLYLLGDAELKEVFRDIMKKFEIGDNPGAKKKKSKKEMSSQYNPNPDAFPKSRTMYEDEVKIKPLGWAIIMNEAEYQNSRTKNLAHEAVKQEFSTPLAYVPKYFTGKLKAGVVVDALCVGEDKSNPRNKIFRLFIGGEGKEQEVSCKYESDIIIDKYCKVKITDLRDGIVKAIRLESLIKY